MQDFENRLTELEQNTLERRKAVHNLRGEVRALYQRMSMFEEGLGNNTKITEAINNDTKELLGLFNSVKGGFRVLGWIGMLAKLVAAISVAIGAAYTAIVKFKR